jgi:drug/metabolite transporter (DMT)-like permease
MPLQALLLLIVAAFFHTGWNYRVKRVEEKQIFTWWVLVAGLIFYVPLVRLCLPIPIRVWPYAISSALVETLFFVALVRAYEQGDFSLVYPVARGAAPAMLALWATLFLGERPGLAGIAGLTTIIAGLTLVGGAGLIGGKTTIRLSAQNLLPALFISFCISVYSAIDGAAVRVMAPQGYGALVLMLTAVFLAPVIFSRYRSRAVFAELRSRGLRILLAAFLMTATFVLVLEAFSLAKVSYVAATREMSIILAALAGWQFMGEQFGLIRTAGSVLIFLGILCIALAG